MDFSGAVHPHQRVNRARLYGQAYAVQRLDARKRLFNFFHMQQHRLHFRRLRLLG